MSQEKLDYKPLALNEQKEAFKQNDPVQFKQNDPNDDRVNARSDDTIRNDPGSDGLPKS